MLKKFILLSLISLTVLGCSSNSIDKDVPLETTIKYSYTENEQYERIWNTKVVHNESVVFKENDDGTISGTLLYEPSSIICVKSSGLYLDYSYSRDYYVRGNKIYLKQDSLLPYLTKRNIECKDIPISFKADGSSGTFPSANQGKYILYTEGPGIYSYQIMVSYTHNQPWQGSIPKSKGNLLTTLKDKLNNKSDINMVTIGDSILVGAGASSFLKIDPNQDTIINGISNEITRNYGCKVNSNNLAVGGTTAKEGIDKAKQVKSYNPDLVIIGYGMNDASSSVQTNVYLSNIKSCIESIRKDSPNASIILFTSILGSYTSAINRYNDVFFEYLSGLLQYEQDYDNLAVLDMTSISKVISDTKYSLELYANNVNHPSDWMVRHYISNFMNLIEYKDSF